ncbi:MAG: NusG domain II-containing protein [Ruthenibacterium sp.]
MKQQKWIRKADVVMLAVLLVLAGGIALWYAAKPQGPIATVTIAGETDKQEIPLNHDKTYTIAGNNGLTVTLRVQDGCIFFENSECPDHLCEGFGKLSHEGEYAICMPAGVSVNIYG